MSKPALIVIDVQNDYFPGGAFPLCNSDVTLQATEKAIRAARAKGIPVVKIQHANPSGGPAPFLNAGTEGVKIHSAVDAAAPEAPLVVKQHADAFQETTLHDTLQKLGVDELLVCGMMTQHCVTYTALSRRADDYRKVTVLADATTTVNEMLHAIALSGLSSRVKVAQVQEVLG